MWIKSSSPRQTFNLGKKLARYLKPKDVLCLYGPLGAGKTVFVKGVASGLGIKESEVNSPAFVLINEYKGKIPLYHIDLYRLGNLEEILTTGYEDYFYKEGIIVIEWAQRLDNSYLMPSRYLKIKIEVVNKNTRKISFLAIGEQYNLILSKLKTKR